MGDDFGRSSMTVIVSSAARIGGQPSLSSRRELNRQPVHATIGVVCTVVCYSRKAWSGREEHAVLELR